MTDKHTPGPLRVIIASTCSGAWPQIVQDCIDPDTNEEWAREIGDLPTAFVERPEVHGVGMPDEYNEKPERFKKTEDHEEVMANAYLWAASPTMLDALRLASKELWAARRNKAARQVDAAIELATKVPA